jgi:DNA adenine methylase
VALRPVHLDRRFERMADQLAAIAAQFVLSSNATPFVLETFARFDVQEAETTWCYRRRRSQGTKVTELIVQGPGVRVGKADVP